MKNSAKFFGYLLIMISLVACVKSPAKAISTQTVTASPTLLTATPSAVVITPEPTFTQIVPPTVAPTIDPAKLPAEIKASIRIEPLEAFNGHNLQHISGWSKGFDGFDWMSSKDLLLYPIINKRYGEHVGNNAWYSYPTVINLDSSKIWQPPTQDMPFFKSSNDFLPKWSAQAGVLLASDTDTVTLVYTPDGDVLKTYEGKLAAVSPSGSKILVVSENQPSDLSDPVTNSSRTSKWIDLLNNKEVIFDWEEIPGSFEYTHFIWSSDEMSIYINTEYDDFYGNAKTGESYRVSYRPFNEDDFGRDDSDHLIDQPRHSFGTWVLNNTYLLARWDEYNEGTPGFLSFFDPAKKAYRNLSALVGLPYLSEVAVNPDPPYPCDNGQPIATSGGRYIWVNCQDGGLLIDMQTFKTKTYPVYRTAKLKWSADGNFAFISDVDDDQYRQILSAADKQLTPIPTNARCYAWHPKQSVFVFLSSYTETLLIFDARSMSIRQTVDLPTTFRCPVWNDRGNKLTMIAENESLWQIDYPALNHFEQLTQPIKGLKNFIVSPEDRLIALPVGPDIYIVNTSSKP